MNTLGIQFIIDHCRKHGLPIPANVSPPSLAIAPKRFQIGTGQTLALTIQIDLRTVSEANASGKFRGKLARKKAQRGMVRDLLRRIAPALPMLPATVTLTRHGKRTLDDDNLRSAFKAVRDGIADVYGVDDGSGDYRWEYAQTKSKKYSVEIRIEAQTTP